MAIRRLRVPKGYGLLGPLLGLKAWPIAAQMLLSRAVQIAGSRQRFSIVRRQ